MTTAIRVWFSIVDCDFSQLIRLPSCVEVTEGTIIKVFKEKVRDDRRPILDHIALGNVIVWKLKYTVALRELEQPNEFFEELRTLRGEARTIEDNILAKVLLPHHGIYSEDEWAPDCLHVLVQVVGEGLSSFFLVTE